MAEKQLQSFYYVEPGDYILDFSHIGADGT